MTRPEIRYLHSPDVPDYDLSRYAPAENEPFYILVQAAIGPSDEIGEEMFSFLVCNPQGLAARGLELGYLFARHHLIMKKYDYVLLKSAIEKLCNSIIEPDWNTVAQKLSRYGLWEFEDYQPPDV